MVRHHDERIQHHIWKQRWQPFPFGDHHPPRVVESHFPVYHLAKQASTPLRADGNKVRTCL
jgi:hypothetical protein